MSNKTNFEITPQEYTPSFYVGIGASAGGLEAIEGVIKNISIDSSLAYIIIQHLSPDYKSMMVELLSKVTNLPVQRAENGMEVKKNNIYLIPPKKDMTIFHGKLLLSDQDRGIGTGINLPIDTFFQSLADDQESKAIGVVLSGTGSDGTRGLRTIKERGGMVIVQSVETAKFDGMPQSAIDIGIADIVASPEAIAENLSSISKHPFVSQNSPTTIDSDEDALTRIFYLLRERRKVDFTFYKPNTVLRRLERRLTVNQVDNLKDYLRYLETYPVEIDHLYRELLIGVTRFFRDDEAFSSMRHEWLPDLIKSKKNNKLRFWVAGCSTGEEAYSLAILCQEIIAELGIPTDVKIFATDIDQTAIQKASSGIYMESIMADIDPTLVSKYFYHKENGFQVSRVIREMVVFAQHDIIKDPPFTNIDLVTCRNVMIYFQPILQQRALEMFNFSLNQGGVLFLGSSETTGDMENVFDTLNQKEKIYRSFGKRRVHLNKDQMGKYSDRAQFRQQTLPLSNHKIQPEFRSPDDKILDRFLQTISNSHLPLTIIVNNEMQIEHVFGNSEGYFAIPSGKMDNNLIKMARKEFAIPLATGIAKVFKTGKEQRYSNIQIEIKGESVGLNLDMTLLEAKSNQEPLIAIFFEKIKSKTKTTPEDDYDVGKETQQRILDLEQELQFTRENLQATVEELETSNEELQATNEELLASNEELQSTNEELQSVNEELYTVNAEHQSKIVELMETNNDLDNLLLSTNIATVFLDEDLELRKFTPEISQFFKLLEHDIGRPISHIPCNLVNVDVIAAIEQVKVTNETLEQEVMSQEGTWFSMRILPYRIASNVFSGVVITFVSINNLKMIQEELNTKMTRFLLAQQSAKLGVWEWDMDTNDIHCSEGVEPLFGLLEGEFGSTFDYYISMVHPDDKESLNIRITQALDSRVELNFQHRIIWSDGSIHWLSVDAKPFPDNNKKSNRMIGVFRDITDKKKSQIELEHTESMFRFTIENMDMVAIQVDTKGIINFANDFLLQLTGWEHDEIVGKDWINTLFKKEKRAELKERFRAFIIGESTELYPQRALDIVCKNGETKEIWWNSAPLLDVNNQLVCISSIGEDISKQNCPVGTTRNCPVREEA